MPPLFPYGILFMILIHRSYFPEITTFQVIPFFPTNKKMFKNTEARACESPDFLYIV